MTNSRVESPQSLTSPRAERWTIPISPSESPYEYVEALRVAQGGRCSCGKCERSSNVHEVRRAISEAARATLARAGWPYITERA